MLYRLLFMLYAEARDLLPVRENRLYAESYSLEALKSRIVRDLDDDIPAAASMSGLWQQLYEQWHVIDTGDAALGVPAYNGGLFRPDRILSSSATGWATCTCARRWTCWRAPSIRSPDAASCGLPRPGNPPPGAASTKGCWNINCAVPPSRWSSSGKRARNATSRP